MSTIAPTDNHPLFAPTDSLEEAAESDSDSEDEYDEHEGVKGTWTMRCGCGSETVVLGEQCYGSDECGNYEVFFRERPRPTRKERARKARNMRIFRGLVLAKVGARRWRLRAAERAYAPGGRGHKKAKTNYHTESVRLIE
tara:strand:+ start:7946 stop:8365 length:420 start_codon:yes stop_codon:yes gene_type:complete